MCASTMVAPTSPPSRDVTVARTGSSPGFGLSAPLPGCPVGIELSCLPVTVAGPRRSYTGFRAPRSRYFSCLAATIRGGVDLVKATGDLTRPLGPSVDRSAPVTSIMVVTGTP
jgi:hypothetical protein